MKNKNLEQAGQESVLSKSNNRRVRFEKNDQFPELSKELLEIVKRGNFVCLCIKEDDGDYLASLIAINSSAAEMKKALTGEGDYQPKVPMELISRISEDQIRSYLDANYSGPNLARKFEESIERLSQNHINPIRNRDRRILLIFSYDRESNSYTIDVLYANKCVNKHDNKGSYYVARNTQFRTSNIY